MIYLSYKAEKELIDWISGFKKLQLVGPIPGVDPRINDHADLIYCRLKGNICFFGDPNKLETTYPGDCIYNAAIVGHYLVHKEGLTDPELLENARKMIPQLELITVNQGYTKCNCLVVDNKHVITSDQGIAKALNFKDIEVLLIQPGHIILDGFDTGFIGGASGKVGEYIVFNGDITAHPDYVAIKEFIESCGLKIKDFSWPLKDIGSIV